MNSVSQNIKNKLGVLNPLHLEVVNESHRHRVPDNAETHFKVVIVSENFVELGRVPRHQQINKLLVEELEGPVHALSIHAFTPEEWYRRNGQVPDPPNCISK